MLIDCKVVSCAQQPGMAPSSSVAFPRSFVVRAASPPRFSHQGSALLLHRHPISLAAQPGHECCETTACRTPKRPTTSRHAAQPPSVAHLGLARSEGPSPGLPGPPAAALAAPSARPPAPWPWIPGIWLPCDSVKQGSASSNRHRGSSSMHAWRKRLPDSNGLTS